MKKKGRPTKYKNEYCQMLINHMSKGYSFESFAAICEVNDDSLYEWAKQHKEFSDAKKTAYLKNRIFWEKAGIEGMQHGGKDFNATVWIFNMKNRFHWRDKHDIDMDISGNMKTDNKITIEFVNSDESKDS